VRKPSDLGYSDDDFVLPPLNVHEHVVHVGATFAKEAGLLFATNAQGLAAQRAARRSSLAERVRVAADIVRREPGEQWLIWCDLNLESKALKAAIDGSTEVTGSDEPSFKERALLEFAAGRTRYLISKPSILGWGMNLQNCARVIYVGLSNSFELWYQSMRRIWRFGQKRACECHIVISDADGAVRANLLRKQCDAEEMSNEMVLGVRDIQRTSITALSRETDDYTPQADMRLPDLLSA